MHCLLKYTQVLASTKHLTSTGAKNQIDLEGYIRISKEMYAKLLWGTEFVAQLKQYFFLLAVA